MLRFAADFLKQRVHRFLPETEIRVLKPVKCLGKIENAVLCGEAEYTQRAGDGESFTPGGDHTFAIIQ